MQKIAITAVTMTAIAAPALAAELSMETELGKTAEEVTASLINMGYEVREHEMEDGELEVYFTRNGQKGEVTVDPETGKPVEIEIERH